METNVTPEVAPEVVTYANAVIDTPQYEALRDAAVEAGVITADQRPARIALVKGTWTIQS